MNLVRMACQRGDCEGLRDLLEKGADVNEASEEDGQTALMEVASVGNASVALVLITFADDIVSFLKKSCRDPSSIFHYAAPFIDLDELRMGARVDDLDFSGRSALWLAARNGRARVVELLMDHGACVDSRSESGRTPLFIACRLGHVDTAASLLRRGANPNLRTKFGVAPLDAAVHVDRSIQLATLLLDAGADIDFKGTGCTPLYAACQAGLVALAKLLLERGADVNLPAKNGITCLEIAMRGVQSLNGEDNHHEASRRLLLESMLLEHGAELR